jgi:opacity protein-like surface antigen
MRVLLAAALLLLTPVAARADVFAVPFAGVKFGGSTSIFDIESVAGENKFTMGAALMRVDTGLFGYEAMFGYVPGYFERDNLIWAPGSFLIDLTGSLVLALPPSFTGGGLRPYATGGGGLTHVQAEDKLGALTVRRTVPGWSAGAGAIGLVTNNVGVRFDYRYVRSLTTDDGSLSRVGRRISYSRFTIGLYIGL